MDTTLTMTDIQHIKIPLPKFLKLLTDFHITVPRAMALSARIYKEYNTPARLAQIDDIKLVSVGVDNKDDRKAVIAALRESGYLPKDARKKVQKDDSPVAGPSSSTPPTSAVQAVTTPLKRKRKRHEDVNIFLPAGPKDEAARYGSLDFGESLDEEVLNTKSTVVNRAPLLTAWATLVAERLGFRREEALSIASVYTEMNAAAKGVSLGIYEGTKERGMEAVRGGSQSYIEFMGRRPLYRTQTQQWRALSKGSPISPSTAFSYICRSFRQTTPYTIGALKLLADSFPVSELNGAAWSLYAEFRPTVDKWGARSEVQCSRILDLRKKDTGLVGSAPNLEKMIEHENTATSQDNLDALAPPVKKSKPLSLEEYEASLDAEFAYDDVDLTSYES